MADERVLFLWPHHDDDCLWTAFSLMAELARGSRVNAVTVFESHVQEARGTGIKHVQRMVETTNALNALGLFAVPGACTWRQWAFRDDAPPLWSQLVKRLSEERDAFGDPFERVYAPAVERGGHAQHNLLGEAAAFVWPDSIVSYLTYTNLGKSRGGKAVPYEPWMITRKLRALACYQSQIENPGALSTEHFMQDLCEWVAL